ncbi:MAG: hypothetical protein F4Y95_10410 [Chloroflexi bacterium]|nr:hypothetical protein [Chloroflexota bacterium]
MFSLLLGLLLLHGLLLLLLLLLLLGRLRLILLLLRLRLDNGLLLVVIVVAAADQRQTGRANAGPGRGPQQRSPRQPLTRHALPIVACAHDCSFVSGYVRPQILRRLVNFERPNQSGPPAGCYVNPDFAGVDQAGHVTSRRPGCRSRQPASTPDPAST